jgi:hypothetical protein
MSPRQPVLSGAELIPALERDDWRSSASEAATFD